MCYEQTIDRLTIKLKELEDEHSELKQIVDDESSLLDEITLQRIKKRKLKIKDEMIKIRAIIYPNIIA